MRAFHGDEDLKRRTRDRLAQDVAAGAIERGPTAWHESRGSIAGALLRGSDLTQGAKMLGLPADVLALIDHFGGHIFYSTVATDDLALRCINACGTGTDLRTVVPDLLHRVRRDPPDGPEDDATADNTAADAIDRWVDAHARAAVHDSGWSEAREAAAQAVLQDLWNETRDRRHDGDWPDYPALFRLRDPALAEGYERALALYNAVFARRVAQVVDWFVEAIAAAPTEGQA